MRLLLLLLLTFSLFSIPAQGHAETNIVVVDVQRLLTDSDAAKNIRAQFDQNRKSLEQEFAGLESSLREQQKSIIENRGSMAPEEFDRKRQSFEKELELFRRF